MLTKKEINFLNMIFKKLDSEQEDLDFVTKFLMKNLQLNLNKSFELAYLYVKNWNSEGDFNDIESPERLTYEEFLNDYPPQLVALTMHTGNLNIDAYDTSDTDEIEFDGTKYRIFDDWSDVESEAIDSVNYICDDVDGESARHYLTITDTDKRIFAGEESDFLMDQMDDEEIIEYGNISDIISDLSELEDKISDWKELIEEKENSDNQEEIDELEERQSDLEYEIDELKISTSIEFDMDSQNISQIISIKKEEIIDEIRKEAREEKYDQIYNELDDPYQFFIKDQGLYSDVEELLRHSYIVNFDCGEYKKDFIDGMSTDELMRSIGYDENNEVTFKEKTYYIAYN